MRAIRLKNCETCGQEFGTRRKETRFCSVPCSNKARGFGTIKLKCAYCKSTFSRPRSALKKSKSKLYFCTRRCKEKAQRLGGIKAIQSDHYGDGEWSYRKRALEHYGAVCQACEYSEDSRMLDVHHKDDTRDGKLENLEVLCVWCHALKTRKVESAYRVSSVVEERRPYKSDAGGSIPSPGTITRYRRK